MQIGRLDRRIVIEQNTPTRSATGAEVDSWSTLATVWAGLKQQSGGEFIAAEQTVAERKVVWTIRYRTDVTTKMRVSYGGNIYNINALKEIARRAGLELLTTAIGV